MNRHRLLASALALFVNMLSASPAVAQGASRDCTPIALASQVVVTLRDGSTRRGMLLCMGERETRIAVDGQIDRHPLADITRVVKPRDRVWDGFLKGAAIPLLAWAAFCSGCDGGSVLPRAMLGYGTLGLAFDAMHGGTRELYANGRTR